jgi:hypothetical protein
MRSRGFIAAVVVAASVCTHADASGPPPVALSASPTHIAFKGAGRATVTLANAGTAAVVVDVAPAELTLDVRGRPAVVGGAAAVSWLRIRPHRVALAPGARTSVSVTSLPPRSASAGDHTAVVLFSTRPRATTAVAIRMRLGISVVTRMPGAVQRRIELRSLAVQRSAGRDVLRLGIANRGNVIEQLERGRVRLALVARGRVRARLQPPPRELLPRTSGICELGYAGGLRGWVTVVVAVLPTRAGEPAVRRSFRIRL